MQTSCGYGVPLFEFTGQRDPMGAWAAKKGPDGLQGYRFEHTQVSVDGLPTGLPTG